MPDPIKRGLQGIQSLLRHPENRVMLVQGQANFDAAIRMFPANPVLGWEGKLAEYHLGQLEDKHVVVWFANPLPQHVRHGITDLDAPAASMAVFSPEDPMQCHPLMELERRNPPRQWILAQLKPVDSYVPAPLDALVNGVAESVPVPPKTQPAPASTVVEMRTYQQAKAQPELEVLPAKFSEDAIAAAFTATNPNLRYVAAWGKWLEWNGTYWKPDDVLSVFDRARIICRSQSELARAECAPSTVRSIVSARAVSAVERLARADPAHAAVGDQWDADPWLLNTPGGIVDLRDGSMRPGRPEDHLSRITNVAPGGRCDAWMQFLHTATNGDMELMGFMARMAGYSLTGSVREHALFFVYGTGGNGKGTFLNQLTWILGDYAHTASMESFTESRSDQHPTATASLMGRRLVSAQETEEGRRWAESKIKALTGGDPITARFMRQDEFTFQPQFKLVVVGNHKPVFRNVDDAIRRRLHLIPFTHKVDTPDKCLPEKLRAEAPGILAWAIAGCVEWLRDGLNPPECVKVATDDYLVSQDSMATWIGECCDCGHTWRTKVSVLYNSHRSWCEANGEFVVGRKRFVEAMLSRGYDKVEERNNSLICGLRVRPSEDDIERAQSRFKD